MNNIFLGLGSNIEDRLANLKHSVNLLKEAERLTVIKVSSIYETEPVGYTLQPYFLNMVVEIQYDKTPKELLKEVKSIEKTMGRETSFYCGPRVIDIDILYFSTMRYENGDLCIPHPEVRRRRFVIEPLCEIVPDFRCPVSQLAIRELYELCPDRSIVKYFCHLNKNTKT